MPPTSLWLARLAGAASFLPFLATVAPGCSDPADTTGAGSGSASTGGSGGGGDTAASTAGSGGDTAASTAGSGGDTTSTTGSGGADSCGPGEQLCGRQCVPLDAPAYGCATGDCAACALPFATATCAAGACAVEVCDAGHADCNASPGCETDLQSDAAHCGQCGLACALPEASSECVASACAIVSCSAGFEDCNAMPDDGCEIDVQTSLANCGGCGLPCAAPNGVSSCALGTCDVVCNAGFVACGEQCLAEGPASCGPLCAACSAPANGAATCADGACGFTCNGGYQACDAACCALPGTHLWSRAYGRQSNEFALDLAIDSSGSTVMTGVFLSPLLGFGDVEVGNAGAEDIFLAKVSSTGQHVWSRSFGGAKDDIGESVALDSSGNVLVTGGFSSSTLDLGGNDLDSTSFAFNIFVAKLSPNGVHLWSKRLGSGGNNKGRGIAADSAGNVFVTGYFSDSANFGGSTLQSSGSTDAFLVKLDPAGNHLWSKRFGDTLVDLGVDLAVDGSGNVFVAAGFTGTVDFDGTPLVSPGPFGSSNTFLAKLDGAGNHLWSKAFAVSATNGANGRDLGIAVDAAGGLVMTGRFDGSITFGGATLSSVGYSDVFIVKYDAAGNHLWSRSSGSTSADSSAGVAVDAQGNVLQTGSLDGAFLQKYDPNGVPVWSKSWGLNAVGYAVGTDASGNAIASGSFTSATFNLGGATFTNKGFRDIFLAKYAP